MLKLTILLEFTSEFASLKQVEVNFQRQMGRFYSVEGGSPRSFDRPPSLI